MIDKEKVIKGLKCCLRLSNRHPNECLKCPYISDMDSEVTCMQKMGKDALKLLKKKKRKKAKLLTLDEAVNGTHVYYVEFQSHLDRGWVKCDFDRMYVDGEVAMLFLRDKTFYQQKEHYGQLWRLWSNQPTDEQMKAVKWDELQREDC